MTKENFQEKLELYLSRLEKQEIGNPMRKHNDQITANLSEFIKRNKKLLHFNIDSTQLTEYMLFQLCKCLTRAQSLLSLHASNNPGITEDLKQYIWRRVRAKNPVVQYHHIEMEEDKEEKSW